VVQGLNQNVRYRGQQYHVQTEDLGAGNPHVVTHLFQGGNVVATARSGYADLLEGRDLARSVRQLMERQHKDMLRDLVSGRLDHRLRSPAALATSYQPGQLAAKPPPPPPAPTPPAASAPPVCGPAAEPGHEVLDDSIDRAILAYLAGEPDDGAGSGP
jgi:hypothetical protein